MTECQHYHMNETTFVDTDAHGRRYAQIVYECPDCPYREWGEKIYFANIGRGTKDPRQKDWRGR